MKQIILVYILFCLVPSFLFAQTKQIQTGDPIPQKVVQNSKCNDNYPDAIRLLGWSPHVPFAIITQKGITSAGNYCCSEWAASKDDWYCLDKWGKSVGKAKIISGDGYDVTQCYELNLNTIEGDSGIGLYTSKKTNWEVPDSCKWTPETKDLDNLNRFITQLESILIDTTLFTNKHFEGETEEKSTMFFFKIHHPDSDLGPTKCVAFAQKFLVVAYVNPHGNWILMCVLHNNSNCYGNYKILALTDINQNGTPEIIFNENTGEAWFDKILSIYNYNNLNEWEINAVSVGGATL